MPYDTAGQRYVLARAWSLFTTDVRDILKATLAPYATGERTLLATLLPHLKGDDLLLMDRGLPFLARLDGMQWPCVADFLRSGQRETVATLSVLAHVRMQAAGGDQTLTDQILTLRLVKVVLAGGRVDVLATSPTDRETDSAAFADLYHAGWTLGEAFKRQQPRRHLEHFTGEMPDRIQQDFHAKVYTANFARRWRAPLTRRWRAPLTRRYPQTRPNATAPISPAACRP